VAGGLTWAEGSTTWGARLKGGVALVTDLNGARKPVVHRTPWCPVKDPSPDTRSVGCLPQLLCSASLIMKDAIAFQCEQSVGDFPRLGLAARHGEEPRRDEIEEATLLGKFRGQGLPCVGVIRFQQDSECEVESVALHSGGNERILRRSHHVHAVAKVDVIEIRGDCQDSRRSVLFQATAKTLPHLLRVRFRGYRKPWGLLRFLSFWKGLE